MTQIKRMTGGSGQLFEIEKLRAPVTLAKGMHVIHVADDRPQLFCKNPLPWIP